MNPDLERLVQLQHAESELKRVEADREAVPRVRGELVGKLAEERGRLDAARSGLDACQKARRQHEQGLQDLEAKRSKYKGQLMDVKTNKEYTAMLHEIEAVERDRKLEEEAARLRRERDQVAGTVPEEALALFQRVARLRGTAVAEARDGMCQLCHMKLRLQMYVELKRNEVIVQCPSCSRILYYEPPVPTVAPEP